MGQEDRDLEGWHLDKRVPLGLIFAVFVQTITVIWFLTDLRNDVDNLAVSLDDKVEQVSVTNERQWNRINRNEELIQQSIASIQTNTAILERVEQRLSRIINLLGGTGID